MAESVGISRSAVSREFVAASEAQLKGLCERRLDELEILIVYLDGIQFAEHHVIVALGVELESAASKRFAAGNYWYENPSGTRTS
jgi:hypothetical protein